MLEAENGKEMILHVDHATRKDDVATGDADAYVRKTDMRNTFSDSNSAYLYGRVRTRPARLAGVRRRDELLTPTDPVW